MQSLGGSSFEWNPDRMGIPERRKPFASVQTYTGAAIFQWALQIAGVQVVLEWEWMSVGQYNTLRSKYISAEVQEWDPENGETFSVVVADLNGKYFDTALKSQPHRRDVRMVLQIIEKLTTTTTAPPTTTTV